MSITALPVAPRVDHRPSAPGHRRGPALAWIAVALVVLVLLAMAQVGCRRMLTAAPPGSHDESGRVVQGYTWSVRPLGFTVRYADGSRETHLWW